MITWAMPFKRATSVPGFSGRNISAIQEVGVARGSATITVAPRSLARWIQRDITGWFSARFDPMINMHRELAMSGMGLVIPAAPRVLFSPTTDGAWQRRAQLSM